MGDKSEVWAEDSWYGRKPAFPNKLPIEFSLPDKLAKSKRRHLLSFLKVIPSKTPDFRSKTPLACLFLIFQLGSAFISEGNIHDSLV